MSQLKPIPILGLSLYQPWATLIALRAKQYETRSWSTSYRGVIAIHASKKFTKADQYLCYTEPFNKYIKDHQSLPIGAFVALAKVEAVYKTEYCHQIEKGSDEEAFGNYEWYRFAWQLKDIIALPEPIPYKGSYQLFQIEHYTLEHLREYLKRANSDAN